MRPIKKFQVALFLCLAGLIPALADGQDRAQRVADLERKLTEAKDSVAVLQKTIESLSTVVQALRQPDPKSPVPAPAKITSGPLAASTAAR